MCYILYFCSRKENYLMGRNVQHILSAEELLSQDQSLMDGKFWLGCREVTAADEMMQRFSSPVQFGGLLVFVVLSGSATVYVNYKPYRMSTEHLLVVFHNRFFRFEDTSADFHVRMLVVSREYTEQFDSIEMISRRTRYGVLLYNCPISPLDSSKKTELLYGMEMLNKAIRDTSHLYHHELVKGILNLFYLNISDVSSRAMQNPDVIGHNLTRQESIINSFIELLSANYREKHTVDFYAERLGISSHYLTLMVKRVTGQTVSEFIFEMLFSESRILLLHSRLSVQQIACRLCFSDQSAFRKFFRRMSGYSPLEFRKKEFDKPRSENKLSKNQ